MSRGPVRWTLWPLLALALSACTSAPPGEDGEDAPAFPERVVIRTPRLACNWFFDYALDDRGRIWAKPNRKAPETDGMKEGWHLLGSGLPENANKPDFVKPDRIVAIHADADELMAISGELRHYSLRWMPNPVFAGTPRQWTDIEGWPVEGPHVWDERVKENRGWGIGRRNQLVDHFEDPEGKSHWGGGGLTTYYFLSKDGTEVYFSDSGLPPDFSHTLAGPRRSTFVARGFDVSASTLFVIGERGEMFTRLADFDTGGNDIMFFEYTYDRRDRRKNVIAIPSEDWLAHAKIPLEGKARISSQITILLTGPRNQGRELRVAGEDAEGRPGYYRKPIFFQKEGSPVREEVAAWKFEPVPGLALDPARFLDPVECRKAEPAPGVPLRDVALSGELLVDGEPAKVQVELADWNLVCSPARLRLSSGDAQVDLVFHTVEEWYHLKRKDPGRDGTPKKFLGTLEVPETVFATTRDPALRALLEVLRPYDLHDFAFWVEATNEYLRAEVRDQPRGAPRLSLQLTRSGAGYRSLEAARRQTLHQDGFTLAASSEKLKVAGDLRAFADGEELAARIAANEAVRRDLAATFEEPRKLKDQTPFYVTAPGIQFVKGLGTLLAGAAYWAPYVKNLMGELPSLIVKNDELAETIVFISREDYDQALAILDTRIAAYRRRLEEVRKGLPPGSWVYRETPAACWQDWRAGERTATARGALNRSVPASSRITVDDAEIATATSATLGGAGARLRRPSLVVEATFAGGDPAERLRLRVAPLDLTKRIFEASLQGPVATAGHPLRVDAKVTLDYLGAGPAARMLHDSVFAKQSQRDAEEMPATLTIEDARFELSLDGLAIAWERR